MTAPAVCALPRNDTLTGLDYLEHRAPELVELIAGHLAPAQFIPSEGSMQAVHDVVEQSRGAAHWLQLSSALSATKPSWNDTLQLNRRRRSEAAACCRVLECREKEAYDWALEVLRLRGEGASVLSHATPLSKQILRMAYVRCAKEVHPDRLQEVSRVRLEPSPPSSFLLPASHRPSHTRAAAGRLPRSRGDDRAQRSLPPGATVFRRARAQRGDDFRRARPRAPGLSIA